MDAHCHSLWIVVCESICWKVKTANQMLNQNTACNARKSARSYDYSRHPSGGKLHSRKKSWAGRLVVPSREYFHLIVTLSLYRRWKTLSFSTIRIHTAPVFWNERLRISSGSPGISEIVFCKSLVLPSLSWTLMLPVYTPLGAGMTPMASRGPVLIFSHVGTWCSQPDKLLSHIACLRDRRSLSKHPGSSDLMLTD